MDVIELAAYRQTTDGRAPARCACGSEWFVLRGRPSDPSIAATGAVTLSGDGRITGYVGEPVCAECETSLRSPAGGRL